MTREDIRFVRKVVPVEVPGWDKPAHVRSWSGADLCEWEDALNQNVRNGKVSLTARVVCIALSLCDADGKRVCKNTPEDVAWLGDNLSPEAFEVLWREAGSLNRVRATDDPIKAAEGN